MKEKIEQKLIAKEAKEISLELWDYLRHNLKAEKTKEDLPPELWNKVKHFSSRCGLCEFFIDTSCSECPLDNCCYGSSYNKWRNSDLTTRFEGANEIYNKIKNWDISEYDETSFKPYKIEVEINTEEQESALYALMNTENDTYFPAILEDRDTYRSKGKLKEFTENDVELITYQIYETLDNLIDTKAKNKN